MRFHSKEEEPTLPMKRLSMRKLKEVLRLRYELGLGQRQIARSCSIGQATVHEYLKRAQAAGDAWPLAEGWDDRRLEEALFGPTPRRADLSPRPTPDFAELHEELQRHPHLTLQLVWEEYRRDHPDGYAYSRFCELYREWRQRLDVVLRQEHKAGEKLFVDYAGDTILIYDPTGGRNAKLRSSLPSWAPATIPTRKRPRGRTSRTGSARTSARSNFSEAPQGWSSLTILGRA